MTTRSRILAAIASGCNTTACLTRKLKLSHRTVTQHISALRYQGRVVRTEESEGKPTAVYSVVSVAVTRPRRYRASKAAALLLESCWRARA